MTKPKLLNVRVTLQRIVRIAEHVKNDPKNNQLCPAAYDELQGIAFIARATLANHAKRGTRKDMYVEAEQIPLPTAHEQIRSALKSYEGY